MKCFFCNEEFSNEYSEYPPLDSCFNCGRELCSDCRGSTEKIAGDIRGVYCHYCKDIRNFDVVPIEIEEIYQWINILNSLLNEVSSDQSKDKLVNLIKAMKYLLPDTDETLI